MSWRQVVPSLRSWRWWLGKAILVGFWVLLGWPVYQKSVKQGIAHTIAALFLLYWRAKNYSSSETVKVVQRQYLERKLMLYRLVKDVQRRTELGDVERARFQQDVLQLVASYVRGHRADVAGTGIFVNLLVEEGDDLVVIARDSNHRLPGARYPKVALAAWKALQSGMLVVVGELQQEYPGHVKKPYRSILLLPVRGKDSVLAVVSIDSAKAYHFDIDCEELERYVSPYLALLEWSLMYKTEG